VGPDHIVQIVNSRMAIFTKKGSQFETTGHILYGPVVTSTIFASFGGQCEKQVSGQKRSFKPPRLSRRGAGRATCRAGSQNPNSAVNFRFSGHFMV